MEVAIPMNPTDHFDFNSHATYANNAPSTPRFMQGDYFSAPNSPTRIPDFDQLLLSEPQTYSQATVPFAWEEKPGVPKSTGNLFDADFAFDVSGRDSSVTAEDMFQHGVIKPVELDQQAVVVDKIQERERGRERSSSGLSSSRSRRTRSLPPFRGTEQPTTTTTTTTMTTTMSSAITTLSVFGSKKWSFKDLFLFRSASDGRAMDKDPLKKYSSIFWKHEDFRNSTLRDRSGSGSGSGSSRRRGPRVSAHELHYTVNRAVSNDMKKQTFLPYKQGILGRLAFNPTVHALSNGFGNSHSN
ncbi:hypothetical protein HanPI659440_Chr09g0350011 [Helianthus annuus]|nr:hypothetical protein HanPI659440_Chr09g0350011 [Helianthus annuus]